MSNADQCKIQTYQNPGIDLKHHYINYWPGMKWDIMSRHGLTDIMTSWRGIMMLHNTDKEGMTQEGGQRSGVFIKLCFQ